MATILEMIQKPQNFDVFINENMKNATYKVGWDAEMDVEYEASKSWAAATVDYTAAMLGTVIDKFGGRPKRDMPNIGDLSGSLARMGDEYQLDNDRLERYYLMEGRLRDKKKTLSNAQYTAQFQQLTKYLFQPYEQAAIAPHRRILSMYWEGLSDGQVTLTKTNNTGGIVWTAALPTGIVKNNLRSTDVVWSTATIDTMDVLSVLQYAEDLADAAGKTVLKHRISKATASLICQSKQLKNLLGMTLGRLKTESTPMLSVDIINQYLTSLSHAPIEVINDKGLLTTGTSVSMFKDGRLVSMCAPKVAVLKVSDPLEAIDPVPNKVYSNYYDNLISQWRNESGRYVAYEMFAYPAFTGKNDVFILDVTQKNS